MKVKEILWSSKNLEKKIKLPQDFQQEVSIIIVGILKQMKFQRMSRIKIKSTVFNVSLSILVMIELLSRLAKKF